MAHRLAGRRPVTFSIGDGFLLAGSLDDHMLDWAFQGLHRRDAGFMHSLSLIDPGDTVVDVGANVGIWTILAASRAGDDGKVLAFEPMPGTADQLEGNLRLNGLENVAVQRSALGSESATVQMFGDEIGAGRRPLTPGRRNSGGASLAAAAGSSQVSVEVDARTLDEAVSSLGTPRVSVLKVDVEGAELAVLRGARELLSSETAPAIFLEISPELAERFGCSPEDVLGFLRTCGYKLFRFAGSERVEVSAGYEWREHGDCLATPDLQRSRSSQTGGD